MTNEEIVADKIKEYEVFKKEAEERESKTFEAVEAGLPSATMDTVNMHAKINNEHIKLYKSLDPDHIQVLTNKSTVVLQSEKKFTTEMLKK